MSSGRDASNEIFHNGGPPSPERSFSGLRLISPGGLSVEISRLLRIFGLIPAYSRAKMGIRAPIIVSAASASAPTTRNVRSHSTDIGDFAYKSIWIPNRRSSSSSSSSKDLKRVKCQQLVRGSGSSSNTFRIWRWHRNESHLAIFVQRRRAHNLVRGG